MIEPVYPDDTGEVIKRTCQLAAATSAKRSEAHGPAGSYLPEKTQQGSNAGTPARLKQWQCQASLSNPLSLSLKCHLRCRFLKKGWENVSSQQCPVSCLEGTKSFFHWDWVAGGSAWAGTWAGFALVCKIRPLFALGWERCPRKGEGDTGHIFDPGWLGRTQLCTRGDSSCFQVNLSISSGSKSWEAARGANFSWAGFDLHLL